MTGLKSMLQRKRKRNLFQRLSVGFMTILICSSMVLTVFFSLSYKRQADESVHESIRQIADNNARNISDAFNQMDQAIDTLNSDDSGIQEKLLLYEGDSRSLIKAFYQTVDLLDNYISIALKSFTSRYHAFLFLDPSFEVFEELTAVEVETASLNGNCWIYSDEKVRDEEWFQRAQDHPNQSFWLTLGEKDEICMVRNLQYLALFGERVETVSLGVIFIRMDTSWIQKRIEASDLASDTILWLVDKDGRILYNTHKIVGEPKDSSWLEDGEAIRQFVTLQKEEYGVEVTRMTPELRLVALVPSAEFQHNYVNSLLPFLLFMLVALLVGSAVSVWFSRRMTADILFLARHMRENQMTPIEANHAIQDEDIDVLYESYNTLVAQVEESTRIKMQHMEEKREMELNLMQAQINPHFLCNSLNSVYNVAVLHEEQNIANAVQGLCGFLRYNVSAPNIEVPLQRELDMLENYILLQNFLCGDRIIFDYDVQVDSEETLIPKMLLQPLVENSIMHNIGNEFVEISISCFADEKNFCMVVEDNGNAKNTEAINQLLQAEGSDKELRDHGFGIRNVQKRIKMRYGKEYGLHYDQKEEGGVAARIELPAEVAVL